MRLLCTKDVLQEGSKNKVMFAKGNTYIARKIDVVTDKPLVMVPVLQAVNDLNERSIILNYYDDSLNTFFEEHFSKL
ncbi:hypothetical protein [Bacillus sp. NPDC094106]|uniref:hypothetical protein n=1 Tax=Bacillus sp. NPDC094106 TaxID=3363949 RepID=UPI0037FAF245